MANNHARLLLLDRDQAAALLQPDEVLAAALLQPDEVLAAVRASFQLHASGAGRIFPLLAADAPARHGIAADAITIFDLTGIALQDLSVARMLQRRALATGTGTDPAWPW